MDRTKTILDAISTQTIYKPFKHAYAYIPKQKSYLAMYRGLIHIGSNNTATTHTTFVLLSGQTRQRDMYLPIVAYIYVCVCSLAWTKRETDRRTDVLLDPTHRDGHEEKKGRKEGKGSRFATFCQLLSNLKARKDKDKGKARIHRDHTN